MNINKEQEDIYIDKIFHIFTECRNELSSDRRQVYFGQLCSQIFKWCNQKKKTEDMGEEICIVCNRILKEESKVNIPKEKTEFIKYLYTALKREKANYHRTYESGIIKIPKEKRTRLKEIGNVLKMEESNLGRKLAPDEQTQFLYKWFKFQKKEYLEYIDLLNKKYVGRFQITDNNGDICILNSLEALVHTEITLNNPQDQYFQKLDSHKIKNILEQVLQNTQDRTRECYRSLFTAYCIDKSALAEGLIPLLDNEILESYRKDGKKPNYYDIYLKYHPEVKKYSANVSASDNLKKFLASFKTALEKEQI